MYKLSANFEKMYVPCNILQPGMADIQFFNTATVDHLKYVYMGLCNSLPGVIRILCSVHLSQDLPPLLLGQPGPRVVQLPHVQEPRQREELVIGRSWWVLIIVIGVGDRSKQSFGPLYVNFCLANFTKNC